MRRRIWFRVKIHWLSTVAISNWRDRLLGEIIQCVQRETGHHELLLIVSSDHWLRNRGGIEPMNRKSAGRYPSSCGTVGATQGITVTQPVSTIHTAEMILSYLQGDVS